MADLEPLADGSVPMGVHRSGITYRIPKSAIDTNWLLNAVLGTRDLQITKATDDQIQKFLEIIDVGNLRMPDDELALEWLKKRLKIRCEESQNQRGETWYKIALRYQRILEMIDLRLISRIPQKAQDEGKTDG